MGSEMCIRDRYFVYEHLYFLEHFSKALSTLFRNRTTEHNGREAVSGDRANLRDDAQASVDVGANTGDGVDPLDPNWVNCDIDFGNEEEYLKLKRKLSVQKDVALIVQRRKKAEAFLVMAEAEREIIR